jgi:hypothetical protein
MSCDWNVYCRTCDETVTGFSGANHREDFMHRLIRHAEAIAGLVPFLDDAQSWEEVELNAPWGLIRPQAFKRHLGHELVPQDEYGRCSDDCGEYFHCSSCRNTRTCHLPKGHDGEHAEERPHEEK